jgi:hypothetical protein
MRCNQAGQDATGARHRHLLPYDSAYGQLVRVHTSRDPKSRRVTSDSSQHRVGLEVVPNRHGIGIEVEEASATLYGGCQVPEVVESQSGSHVAVVGDELDGGASVREGQRPGEPGGCADLDPGERPVGQERQDARGFVREAVGEAQAQGVQCPDWPRPPLASQLGGGAREDLPDGVVELPNAGKPGRKCH